MRKIILFRGLVMLLFVSWFTNMFAFDFKFGNLFYSIVSIPERTVEVSESNSNYIGRVVIPSKVKYKDRDWTVIGIGAYAFKNRYSLTELVLPQTIKYFDFGSILGCKSLKKINLPNGLTLRGFSLSGSGLEQLTIPSGTSFHNGYRQVSSMKYLKSIFIESGIDSIGDYTFEENRLLSKVTFSNGVKYLGFSLFNGCQSLRVIDIPMSVTKIGTPFFDSECGIKTIRVHWKEPIEIDDKTFPNGTYLDATLYVPKGTKKLYQSAKGWSNFLSIVEY